MIEIQVWLMIQVIEAARAGHAATVTFLLKHGADRSFKNAAGESAESVAKTTEILDLLKSFTPGQIIAYREIAPGFANKGY